MEFVWLINARACYCCEQTLAKNTSRFVNGNMSRSHTALHANTNTNATD